MVLSPTSRSISLLALLFVCAVQMVYAQFQHTMFVPVAPAELSSSFVRCIYKDSRGFVWLGTGTGLVRYDGTTTHLYEAGAGANTIPDNRINAIIEDLHNNLWIGTAQGLVIYDRSRDNFIDVNTIEKNVNQLSNQYVTSLAADGQGRIWIGTYGNGINVYDPSTFTFSYLEDGSALNAIPPANYVTSLVHADGIVWTSTKGGLRRFDARSMKILATPVTDASLASKEITNVKCDDAGNVWIATIDREIIRLSPEGSGYTLYKAMFEGSTSTEGEGTILTLALDGDGNVWAAGENSGINFIDAHSGRIVSHQADEEDSRALPTNSIRTIYVDNTGITWIGTFNRGAYMIDNQAKKFDVYQYSDFARVGIAGQNIKDLAEDPDGNIWIACDRGGLAVLDPRSEKITFDKAINDKLNTRYLMALLFDRAGNLWVGTWGRGVFKIDLKSRNVQHYKVEAHGFGDNRVFCLYEDSRGNIWVGSAGSGLFRFDPKGSTFVGINEQTNSSYIRRSSYVTSVLEDADGDLWIATLFGLYRYHLDLDGQYVATLYEKSDKPGEIGSFDITTIYRDTQKNLWFGTGDNGLVVLPYGSSVFRGIPRGEGVSNAVRGILIDSRNNVWFSTNRGLAKYNASSNNVRNYTKEDGLLSNEFNANASLDARDGKFYFGSDRGLIAFYPDSIRDNPAKPVVYFTDFKLNNQSVGIGGEGSPLSRHIGLTDEIQLSYAQRSFTIDFVAINYGQSSRSRYCYKLQGFDEDWTCVGSANRAIYTNIDPGRYELLVSATSSDGVVSEEPARLQIVIEPAPWKTWWAFLLYFAIIFSAVYFIHRLRVERIKIRNQLELERLSREQEHALSESKTQFFTNISHEFRTPLSLIAMPLESLLMMDDLPASVKKRLSTIQVSAEKMTRLVNELMDFSKLESSKLRLYIQYGELVRFVTGAVAVFHDLATKRNIHFGVHAMVRSLEGWFDHDKLEKVVVNVLSNAFKFTADHGQINLIMNVRHVVDDEGRTIRFLDLTIADNGIGIPPEELPFIFDKFYQTSTSAMIANPGTGIGLSLTKGLIELHQGTIQVESTPSEETRFLIQLPIDREVYSADDICENVRHISARRRDDETPGQSVSESEDTQDCAQVLVVEDNEELRSYIALELRQQQFSVLEARDGAEGLDMAFERTPDLIISDVLMPGKNGMQLCQELKSSIKTSHIPIVLLTAKAMVDDQVAGLAAGADVYVTKPFSIRFLIAQVNQIIESRQKLYIRFSQDVYLLPGKVASSKIDQAFLQKAIDYIVENLQDPQLTVDSIAEIFNLSRMQVYRKIKALTGKSVVEFIRMVRVKQALKLMSTHQYTLSEIAYQTGFNSSSYFTRVFKDEYGKTPSEYLEQA